MATRVGCNGFVCLPDQGLGLWGACTRLGLRLLCQQEPGVQGPSRAACLTPYHLCIVRRAGNGAEASPPMWDIGASCTPAPFNIMITCYTLFERDRWVWVTMCAVTGVRHV